MICFKQEGDTFICGVFVKPPEGFQEHIEGVDPEIDAKVEGHFSNVLEELEAQKFRSKRNELLRKTDYKINYLIDNGLDYSAWSTYRQALRDSTIDFVLPTPPEGGLDEFN